MLPVPPVALNSVASTYPSVAALSSTSFVVAYAGASNYANAVVDTVSGTTIGAPGTPVALNSVSSSYVSAAALSSTSFVVAYENTSSTYAYAVVDTVSGTTIPVGEGSNTLGMATNAASPGGSVTVASNGIVTGLSGLIAGSMYYWDATAGVLTTTSSTYQVGIALTSSSILLNSSKSAANDQFFGDAVFNNNFRITESPGDPQGLVFENQLGQQIASLDENGNFSITGNIFANKLTLADDSLLGESLLATSTASSTNSFDFVGGMMDAIGARIAALTGTTATTSTATSTPTDIFATSFLQTIEQALVGWFADASNGIGDLFAKNLYATNVTADIGNFHHVTADELCVGTTCVTPAQFQAMVAAANQSPSAPASTSPSASAATDTPPVIAINGDNPAIIQVGASYSDLGATITGPQADLNLGITTFVNGTAMSPVQIDTTQAATDTIDYVVTDQSGLTSTSTRTVIIQAANDNQASSTPANDNAVATTTATSTAN